jgi:hypothetical protein
MSLVIKKMPPALKHGGYSVMSVLPGESAAEFAKLHRELVAEWTPNGALEGETVAAMARALWRKKNLQTLRIAKLAQERVAQIHSAMVPGVINIDLTPLIINKRLMQRSMTASNRSSTCNSCIR